MKKMFVAVLLLASAGAYASETAGAGWVQVSNRNAQILLDLQSRFQPEGASQAGQEGYDDQVFDLRPKAYERQQKAGEKALKELRARLKSEGDARVRQDLEILIRAQEANQHTQELNHELMLPYAQIERIEFVGIRALLDPRVPKARQEKALMRLRRYAGLEKDSEPLATLARARSEERFDERKLQGPYRGQVEQDLGDGPRLTAGIRQLFAASGLTGYEPALAALEKQNAEYDAWLKEKMLPRATADFRLPPAIYADDLKQYGLDIAPEDLIAKALTSYQEIRNEMRALAPLVAKQNGIRSDDYHEVIRALKKKQVYGKDILPLYQRTLAQLETLVRKNNIVTLPQRKASIRLGTEAEAAMIPAPYMSPPQLIGNTGQYGEFVLPLHVPGKIGEKDLKTDDFTFASAAWTLTAHEARPGHELQYSAMVEQGVSLARALFAFNSVNVEGWALYMEAEMKPYLPLDGQLIGLQARLMRAARAFLDPMLNLGLTTPEQARDLLINDVGLSEGLAKEEVDRYTFTSPGQATAYYYGYRRLMETRAKAELALRSKFDRKSFHDFILAQGLLPPDLMEKAVMENYVAPRVNPMQIAK